jgi:Fic family protein
MRIQILSYINMPFSPLEAFAIPELPPPINISDAGFHTHLLRAKTELAELKGYVSAIPDPMLLVKASILREAIASSGIENIRTTLEAVLRQQLFPESEQKEETRECLRYMAAVMHGFDNMKRVPLGNRLILDIHKELMPGASYGYRTDQKQINHPVSNEIIYTAPAAQKLNRLMTNWENYMHDSSDDTDPLIKCAISHYQLEAIHPFSDGDGRTGRIVMALYLLHAGILNFPMISMSSHIHKTSFEYRRLLQQITETGNWTAFIEYMLNGFFLKAKETKEHCLKLMTLWYNYNERLQKNNSSLYSPKLVELIFAFPVINPAKLGLAMNIHYTTASRYLKWLVDKKFLEYSRCGKYQLYINRNLIDILNN